MTAPSLLLWITLAITLQFAVWFAVYFWRHWQEFQALRDGTAPSMVTVSKVASVAAWSGYRSFRVDRRVIEDAAQSVCSFYLVPADGQPLPAYLPGQFLTFKLDVPTTSGASESLIRCYSLSDAPHPAHYRVSIKRIPAPAGSDLPPGRSSGHFHDRVGVGSILQVRAPGGHFHIGQSSQNDAPVVLIAGGIGLTPMLSMLNWCLAEKAGREVWLYYGVRHGGELVHRAHLETLAATHANFHLRFCFSDPQPAEREGQDFHHRGRVDMDLLRRQLPLKPYHFFICGPTPMMASLVTGLEDWGVPDAHIHFEAFGPASIKRRAATTVTPAASEAAPATAPEQEIIVTFAKSGKQLPWQGDATNLLEFAEANGITIDFGCRAGSCGTCQTNILAGEVSYAEPPEFDPETGSCLLCSCVPKTSVNLEA
jgi:ferredoxin-NADP reductase